jgi:hypothetical protein
MRIRVSGTSPAAELLRGYLAQTPRSGRTAGVYTVIDKWPQYTVTLDAGERLCLDSVDSDFERRVEANLEELHDGRYQKQRAGGNRDGRAMVITVPDGLAEAVARAVYRAILQVTGHGHNSLWRRLLLRAPVLLVLLLAIPAWSQDLGNTAPPPNGIFTSVCVDRTNRDVGLQRDAAGVLKVSDCAGTLRDLKVRDLTISGTCVGCGGGGAPVDAQYWVGAANGTLTAEKNLSGFTGLVLNTAGTPSVYAGTDCLNGEILRSLDGSGVATCSAVGGIDFASQLANLFFGSPDGSNGQPDFRAIVDADIPNTITLTNLTQITNRAFSDTTGTVTVARGGLNLTATADDSVPVGDSASAYTARALPSCSNGTTSKLLYNTTTNTFSCGTDQTGSGSFTATEVEIDWDTCKVGDGPSSICRATITDAAVSSSSKILITQSGNAATARDADENEMDFLACNGRPASGTFTLTCASLRGPAHGKFKVIYTVG